MGLEDEFGEALPIFEREFVAVKKYFSNHAGRKPTDRKVLPVGRPLLF
jgi:hypothetical protein